MRPGGRFVLHCPEGSEAMSACGLHFTEGRLSARLGSESRGNELNVWYASWQNCGDVGRAV